RRVLGELHEAAHTGFAGGEWIPLRLLVGDRREEAPFDAGLRLGVVEERAVLRQRLVDAVAEDPRVDALDVARAEVALGVARERAVGAQAAEELVDRRAELGMVRRH